MIPNKHVHPNLSLSAIAKHLNDCRSVNHLKQAHAFLLKTLSNSHSHNLSSHLFTRLLHIPHDNLSYAHNLFDEIPQCNDQFLWTSFIRYHVNHYRFYQAISLYGMMHFEGVFPSGFTFSSVLNACARIPTPLEGMQVHARVVHSGFLGNKVVQTALLDFYAKCGLVSEAHNVFNGMDDKDVVAWTALICGYTKKGMMDEAQKLYDEMGERNSVSLSTMIAGYAHKGDMRAARELYDRMPEKNSVVWVSMIAGYGKCGDTVGARKVFDEVPGNDPTCCAAMLACYAQNGYVKEAVEMYKKLRKENVRVTEVAMVGTISACAQLGDTELANALTQHVEDGCCDRTPFVTNALVHMYSKCGDIDKAWREFKRMKNTDVASYSAMITAFADHGMAKEALDLFSTMQNAGVEANQITFVGVLNACNNGGMVEEGFKHFQLMTQAYRIKPTAEHITCIVDLLGRSSRLEKAYHLILKYVQVSDAGVWGALLKACKVHGNMNLANIAAQRLLVLEPEDTGNYVELANTYASMNKWVEAERVRKTIYQGGMRKSPGCSWFRSCET